MIFIEKKTRFKNSSLLYFTSWLGYFYVYKEITKKNWVPFSSENI